MSHIAVSMLAAYLADPATGINAVIARDDFPIGDGHDAPPDVRVYNELDHGWVARRKLPQPSTTPLNDVEYPCVVVFLLNLSDPAGVAQEVENGARIIQGSVTLAAQLLMQDADTQLSARHGMYLLRAIRGVMHRFNAPSVLADRTALGTQLLLATSIQQADLKPFNEDTVFSPGGILVTYSFVETVPLT